MFRPHIGICKCHGHETIIVVKAGFCKRGNEEHKARKKGKPVLTLAQLRKKIGGKRKITGELQLFKSIWNTRPHVSEISGTLIRRFDVSCFAHLLSKGSEARARLDPENIMLMLPDEHYQYDNGNISDPRWDEAKRRKQLIKEKYNARK